jgi:tetratricopeptide (TPR) repeat protein
MTYHNLGMIALKLQNYAAAERLCSQALAILEKQGNKCDSANAYQVLGVIAVSQNSYLKAGQRFVKSIIGFSDCNATKEAHESALNFMKLYNKSPSGIRKKLITMWEKSIGQFSVKQ